MHRAILLTGLMGIHLRAQVFENEELFVRSLILLLIILQITLLITVYVIAGVEGTIQSPRLTIVNAIAVDPTRAVGAFLIPMIAMGFLTLISLRLRRFSWIIYTRPQRWLWWGIWIAAFVLFFALLGIAAVSLVTSVPILFIFTIAWGISTACIVVGFFILEQMVRLVRPFWLVVLRAVLALVAIAAAIATAITAGLSQFALFIVSLVLALTFGIYKSTFSHPSDFLMRSKSPLSYPPSNPPIVS